MVNSWYHSTFEKGVKYSWICVYQSFFSLASGEKPQIMSKDGWIEDMTCNSLYKNRWQWKNIIFTFCLPFVYLEHVIKVCAQTFLTKEKMCKTKTTEWHNEVKPNENGLKMKICLLTLYLNHFNENKLMFGNALKKLVCFLFYFFCGIGKLICELWHTVFINLRLRQILILRSSALF